jgi:hypothetical protein
MSVPATSTVDQVAWTVLGVCNRQIITDANWQAMGVRGCPKRGAVFDWFMSRDRLNRERFLSREFFVWPFGRQLFVVSRSCGLNTAVRVGGRVLEILCGRDYAKALRFESDQEMVGYLTAGARDYLSDADRPLAVFIRRVQSQFTKCDPRWVGGFTILTSQFGAIPVWESDFRAHLEATSVQEDCDTIAPEFIHAMTKTIQS